MLKIFNVLNVVGLIKKLIKYGDHIKLIGDTAKFWHDQANERGLISPATVVADLIK